MHKLQDDGLWFIATLATTMDFGS